MEKYNELSAFIGNIIFLKEKAGLDNMTMADLLNIDIDTMEKMDSGEIVDNISVEILLHIQKHFGILPHDMFDDSLPYHLKYVNLSLR